MLIVTHLLGGACAGLMYSYSKLPMPWYAQLLTIGLAVAGSSFPDIDITSSKIGSRFIGISTFVNSCFGHRKLFHSPLLYVILYFVSVNILHISALYVGAFIAGVASHIFLDLFNTAGIPLLYPIPYRFSFGKVRAGSHAESAIALSLCFALVLEVAGHIAAF